jgi:hypothetical protein
MRLVRHFLLSRLGELAEGRPIWPGIHLRDCQRIAVTSLAEKLAWALLVRPVGAQATRPRVSSRRCG